MCVIHTIMRSYLPLINEIFIELIKYIKFRHDIFRIGEFRVSTEQIDDA